jgi:hypothetical protein
VIEFKPVLSLPKREENKNLYFKPLVFNPLLSLLPSNPSLLERDNIIVAKAITLIG